MWRRIICFRTGTDGGAALDTVMTVWILQNPCAYLNISSPVFFGFPVQNLCMFFVSPPELIGSNIINGIYKRNLRK